jgi:hypothetical protein
LFGIGDGSGRWDRFALGAVGVLVEWKWLNRREPSDLPGAQIKIQIRGVIGMKFLADILECDCLRCACVSTMLLLPVHIPLKRPDILSLRDASKADHLGHGLDSESWDFWGSLSVCEIQERSGGLEFETVEE